jgi:hypothetical protein
MSYFYGATVTCDDGCGIDPLHHGGQSPHQWSATVYKQMSESAKRLGWTHDKLRDHWRCPSCTKLHAEETAAELAAKGATDE